MIGTCSDILEATAVGQFWVGEACCPQNTHTLSHTCTHSHTQIHNSLHTLTQPSHNTHTHSHTHRHTPPLMPECHHPTRRVHSRGPGSAKAPGTFLMLPLKISWLPTPLSHKLGWLGKLEWLVTLKCPAQAKTLWVFSAMQCPVNEVLYMLGRINGVL